jgi:hypothetical protein
VIARSRPSVVRGYLPIGGKGHDVVQIDQDGAAIKAMNLAQTIQQGEANPSIGQTGREALPSLRSRDGRYTCTRSRQTHCGK